MTPLLRATLTFGLLFVVTPFIGIITIGHERVQDAVKIAGVVSLTGLLLCGLAFIWTVK